MKSTQSYYKTSNKKFFLQLHFGNTELSKMFQYVYTILRMKNCCFMFLCKPCEKKEICCHFALSINFSIKRSEEPNILIVIQA